MGARVELMSRQGCHLCDAARTVVQSVCEPGQWVEVDIDTDPDLQARYGELVPVVLVDGAQIGYWRIDPQALRDALTPEPVSRLGRWTRRLSSGGSRRSRSRS